MHAKLDSLKLLFVVWQTVCERYFSITDEGKAICKMCEQAVSPGGQKRQDY